MLLPRAERKIWRITWDISAIRRQFPLLAQPGLVYLDAAATTPLPESVLEATAAFEKTMRSNVHRGLYPLAEAATVAYENARQRVAEWIGAKSHEVIFTKNGTEALNLIAHSWGSEHLTKKDTILISLLEHHSNVVPWFQAQKQTQCHIDWIPCDDHGDLDLEAYRASLAKNQVKCVALTGQSNVLGVRPPIKDMIRAAHDAGAIVVIDACQLAAHAPIDVAALDADFLFFTGHKVYGPTGIGVVYGKRKLLEAMPPFLGGGMMIREVKRDGFTPADIPQKFEAGTPPIAAAVGLDAALQWQQQFAWPDRVAHERTLIEAALKHLGMIKHLRLLGPGNADEQFGCVSFAVDNVHPHDIAEIAGRAGVCLRAGHHCTQPLHEHLGVNATARLSVGIYNTVDEVKRAATIIESAVQRLS